MTSFFFYGTLLDHDVMALVIGRRLPPAAFVPARLKGHVRRRAKGVSHPIVVRDPGGEVEGVVVGGLTKRDVERLAAFEGPRYCGAAASPETGPARWAGRKLALPSLGRTASRGVLVIATSRRSRHWPRRH
jgi:hypothetical protein